MEFTGRMEIEETLASPGRGRDVGETGEGEGGGKEKGGDGTVEESVVRSRRT